MDDIRYAKHNPILYHLRRILDNSTFFFFFFWPRFLLGRFFGSFETPYNIALFEKNALFTGCSLESSLDIEFFVDQLSLRQDQCSLLYSCFFPLNRVLTGSIRIRSKDTAAQEVVWERLWVAVG